MSCLKRCDEQRPKHNAVDGVFLILLEILWTCVSAVDDTTNKDSQSVPESSRAAKGVTYSQIPEAASLIQSLTTRKTIFGLKESGIVELLCSGDSLSFDWYWIIAAACEFSEYPLKHNSVIQLRLPMAHCK